MVTTYNPFTSCQLVNATGNINPSSFPIFQHTQTGSLIPPNPAAVRMKKA